jgi:hypothetical protein
MKTEAGHTFERIEWSIRSHVKANIIFMNFEFVIIIIIIIIIVITIVIIIIDIIY